jgi:acyl-CoA thioester hydrolase
VAYSYDIEIRYGEVDLQGVVFNAHYLAYVDHCIDRWLRSLGVLGASSEWDIMVKKATVEWSGSAGVGDGSVGERPVFQAQILYIGVRLGTKEPMPPPPEVRAALSE